MQIGMAGLGRMGMNTARRLLKGGHAVAAYNRSQEFATAPMDLSASSSFRTRPPEAYGYRG